MQLRKEACQNTGSNSSAIVSMTSEVEISVKPGFFLGVFIN